MDAAGEGWSNPRLWSFEDRPTNNMALAEYQGVLHLAYTQKSDGQVIHKTYDEDRHGFHNNSFQPKFSSGGNVSLAAYDNKLFCVFRAINDDQLYYAYFDSQSGWSKDHPTSHWTYGDHDLCVIDGSLQLTFGSHDEERKCYQAKFINYGDSWGAATQVNEWSYSGFSCDTSGDRTVMAFLTKDSEQDILFSEKIQNTWHSSPSFMPGGYAQYTPSFRFFKSMGICVWLPPGDESVQGADLRWAKLNIRNEKQPCLCHPRNWMAGLPDSRNVNQLTIPGTHDSHATWENMEKWEWISRTSVVCQRDEIYKQMENGVRYLDLRVNENLGMCHGPVDLKGTLPETLGEIRHFLRDNPRETVLVSVKLDSGEVADNLALAVYRWWCDNDWYSDERWPTLGEVRGKAILLRRYTSDDGYTNIGFGIRWDL